ncbi:Glyoxylase, beta-lactamase superfamily II [Rhizobium sp. NFR07]|uniref:MBL fold metallo-hydrolase n=1 Tax=Rhizobium sp. NFR07 TaxID=1566262 RepID=UPI0008F07D26|nr:MBL fold metallo-hydrolase [Rhizobium sp. NFR07]SFB33760.1 Glyoxylase, beta-lactamase superfamily II [Rhizobium sp. NFR07]
MMSARPLVKGFYEERSGSIQYVVADPATKCCAIIDPVLDYDEKSGSVATKSADAILAYIASEKMKLQWILDTHPHADHFSAAAYLKQVTGVPTAIGARVTEVQKLWQKIYGMPEMKVDGSQWDRLFEHGDLFDIGELSCRVMHSPGHTLASITYVAGDAAFIHDTLFMPDSGSARADFPGGNAADLWCSIAAILELPGETRLFTGHDYRPEGREACWESTVAQQRAENPHVQNGDDFVRSRQKRDATLPFPRIMLHALQVNLNAGRLPEPESNGSRYLKIPLDAFSVAAW